MENLIIAGIAILSGWFVYKKIFKTGGDCSTCSFSGVCTKNSCDIQKIQIKEVKLK